MGHERVGFLPKTKKWNDLVGQMGSVYSSGLPVASVAAQTLQNVRKRYETLFRDDTVKTVFAFLVVFSRACRFPDPRNQLQDSGIPIPDQPTLLSVVKALREQVPTHESASEYGQLALAAAADAIGQWHKQHATTQMPLFQPSSEFFESWRDLGNGAGFCELARLYFGKLTERYLNYFLDRAASATFPNIQQREQFQREIHSHVDDVSKHAFETAKITQSFAAGWFNAHTREGLPDAKEIEGFLAIAFGKLRDELRREGEAK
ncbi:MAG: hypothetical protein PHE61_05860 [Candidatus Omnitrophica bacterium]|nr:hypothetical protein [Candidatus Omnitrophota bacterium]